MKICSTPGRGILVESLWEGPNGPEMVGSGPSLHPSTIGSAMMKKFQLTRESIEPVGAVDISSEGQGFRDRYDPKQLRNLYL